jgi:hypothetical protein
MPVFTFYGETREIPSYMNDSQIVKEFKRFKEYVFMDDTVKEIQENLVTADSLQQYKETLKNGFEKAANDLPFSDEEIDLSKEQEMCYLIRFDTKWSASLVDSYAKSFPDSLSRLLHKDFCNNEEIKNRKILIKDYNSGKLNE